MKMLLVENDTVTGLALEQHLQVLGEVTACTDTETALEASQQIFYPLIILDIEHSGMDESEFCRRIRALPQEDYSMILVLTAQDRLKDLQIALDAGADDYLLKPVTREQLHMRVMILERQWHNFTAHRRAEQALRQARKEWEEIFQAIGQPTIILDRDYHILAANRATLNATGLTKEAIKTKKCFELFHMTSQSPEMCPLEKVLHSESFETVEMEIEALEGVFLVSCTPVVNEQGELQKIIHISTDITEHKQAEEELQKYREHLEELVEERTAKLQREIAERKRVETALRKHEQEFRALAENAPDIVARFDKELRHLYINLVAERTTGIPRQAFIGKTNRELGAPEDLVLFWEQATQTVLRSGQEKVIEFEMPTLRGPGYFEARLAPEFAQDGSVESVLAISRDITERKRAEEALAEERNLLRTLIDTFPDHIYIKDTESQFLLGNNAVARTAGVATPEELVGKTDFEIFPTELAQRYYADEQTVIETGRPLINREEPNRGPETGAPIWFLTTKIPFRDRHGNIAGLLGIARDITERKRVEEALRESEEKYRSLVENLYAGVVIHAPDTRILFSNPAARTFLDLSEEQMLGKKAIDPAWSFFHADGRKMLLEEYPVNQVISAQKPLRNFVVGVYRPQKRDTVWGLVNAFPVFDDNDELQQITVTFIDITERKQAEEERRQLEAQLRQSQKLEALGTLAGGIAHDFNNILGTMLGYTEALLKRYAEGCPEKRYLERVYRAGERATELVRQILLFSRSQEHQLTPMHIAPILDETFNMLRATIPTSVDIRPHIQPNCRPILADSTQIQQVIVNLCVNASHAMRETGGILEVALEDVTYDTDQAHILDLTAGSYLKLIVRDTGRGMPTEVQEHIFEPFFTTKEPGEGAGLGLSVVHGIIKSHHGVITVESAPGRGTTFAIFFPVTDEPVPQGEQAREPGTARRGKGHILIVDDEPDLTDLYDMALTRLGYHVITFHTGEEALNTFRVHPDRFDLVFTDQAMPGMTGTQLSQKLLTIRADLPIILATGYSDTISENEAKALGIRYFLMKPVKVSDLIYIIQEIFERRKV